MSELQNVTRRDGQFKKVDRVNVQKLAPVSYEIHIIKLATVLLLNSINANGFFLHLLSNESPWTQFLIANSQFRSINYNTQPRYTSFKALVFCYEPMSLDITL